MLRIHAVAIQVVGEVMVMLREIERVDPDLARQGRRAVVSVPLNIAEGSDQCGKRRALHYRIALGSARETWSALKAAEAARYIGAPSDELVRKMKPGHWHTPSVRLQVGLIGAVVAAGSSPAATGLES